MARAGNVIKARPMGSLPNPRRQLKSRRTKRAPKYKGSSLGKFRASRSVNPKKFGIKANKSRTVKVKGYSRGGRRAGKVKGHTRSKP